MLLVSGQADAFLLAIAGGPDLLARIQSRYFERSKTNVARVRGCFDESDLHKTIQLTNTWFYHSMHFCLLFIGLEPAT